MKKKTPKRIGFKHVQATQTWHGRFSEIPNSPSALRFAAASKSQNPKKLPKSMAVPSKPGRGWKIEDGRLKRAATRKVKRYVVEVRSDIRKVYHIMATSAEAARMPITEIVKQPVLNVRKATTWIASVKLSGVQGPWKY